MKKSIRILASLLTILALLVSLPISAMAQDFGDIAKGDIVEEVGSRDKVTTNDGTIVTNNGRVKENGETGTIGTNTGTVKTNEGTIVTNDTTGGLFPKEGTVETNNGDIETNKGKVTTNGKEGEIGINSGDVGNVKLNGEVKGGNEGFIGENNGTVVENKADGVIDVNNGKVGESLTIPVIGTVAEFGGNEGTINENYGDVNMNKEDGVIGINDGNVGSNAGNIGDNFKTVAENEAGGAIEANLGTVGSNAGTVEENYGEVTNNGGEVVNNYGTVDNTAGGTLHEYDYTDNGSDLEVKDTAITDAGTYHGVYVEKDAEYTEETGLFAVLKQVLDGESLNLKNLFTKDGYEYAGYQEVDMFSEETTDHEGDTFTANAPAWLRLLWKKIQVAVAPKHVSPEAEPVAKKVASTYIPTEIKIGTTIRVKNATFLVVEVSDGSYVLVSTGKLTQKDLDDMMAYLAKYFTPEQLAMLIGEPEMISEELAAQLFGGNTSHITFRVNSDIFKK